MRQQSRPSGAVRWFAALVLVLEILDFLKWGSGKCWLMSQLRCQVSLVELPVTVRLCQATEPECLIPIVLGAKQLVLVSSLYWAASTQHLRLPIYTWQDLFANCFVTLVQHTISVHVCAHALLLFCCCNWAKYCCRLVTTASWVPLSCPRKQLVQVYHRLPCTLDKLLCCNSSNYVRLEHLQLCTWLQVCCQSLFERLVVLGVRPIRLQVPMKCRAQSEHQIVETIKESTDQRLEHQDIYQTAGWEGEWSITFWTYSVIYLHLHLARS